MASKKETTSGRPSRSKKIPAAVLDRMVEEATAGAYGVSEQAVGFLSMLEEHLSVPFTTEVLGVEVTAGEIEITDDERIVVVCARGKSRQRIPILDLPLPDPPPKGAEWIEAYRRWAGGR